MDRYCTCNRGIGYSNRTSVVPSSNGLDVCSHCGGIVPPESSYDYELPSDPYMLKFKNSDYDEPYDDYFEQAEECSLDGDHSAAIELYEKAFKESWNNLEKCKALAGIAGEYEAMGDCASAEEYWVRCCRDTMYDSFIFIAGWGDFLYRRWRHEEAIEAYEEVLKELKELDYKKFHYGNLRCYARTTHLIISSYLHSGKDIEEEKYYDELKQAIDKHRHRSTHSDEFDAHYISKLAWELYEKELMGEEALILNDYAIELHPEDKYYGRKAIFIRYLLDRKVFVNQITPQDLDLIDEALKMLPKDCESTRFLKTKGDIFSKLGDYVNARVCYALAAKDYDKVDEAEKQLKTLKPDETYISITGVQYYKNFAPFKNGTVLDLIKEEDNPHDMNAIRAEINGETVGYVANSRYTLIKEVSSATDIRNSDSAQAIVEFVLFDEWVIAKLI